MANVAHKNLTGADLHEPKGADAATANHVYVADGAGSGTWQKVTSDSLDATSNPFGAALYHVREQQTASTQAGTFTSGAWRTRLLNTEVTDEIAGSSLSSNQITLPAGTYFIKAVAPAVNVNAHKTRWRNITDGTTTIVGMAAHASSAGVHSQSLLKRCSNFNIDARLQRPVLVLVFNLVLMKSKYILKS
jgi:hypothetical protein